MNVKKIGWLRVLNAKARARSARGIQEKYAQNAMEQDD